MFNRRKKPGWLAVLPRKQFIELAYVVRDGARPRLELIDKMPYDGEEVDALLRARRAFGLKDYRCATWVGPGAYQMMPVVMPKVAPEELKDALRWSVKDSLDYPVEQAVIDALPVPVDGSIASRERMALVVAAKRSVLTERVQAFQRAGLTLRAIDVPEAAQRSIATLFEQPGRGIATLTLRSANGLLTFSSGGELYAFRRIDCQVDQVVDPVQRDALFARVGLELQRSLDGFDRQFSQLPLLRLLIGGHSVAPALVTYLKENLSAPVELLDLNTVLDSPSGSVLANVNEQAEWFTAIGIALRDEAEV